MIYLILIILLLVSGCTSNNSYQKVIESRNKYCSEKRLYAIKHTPIDRYGFYSFYDENCPPIVNGDWDKNVIKTRNDYLKSISKAN